MTCILTSYVNRLGPLKTEKKERKTAGRRNIIRMDTNAVRPTQVKYQHERCRLFPLIDC